MSETTREARTISTIRTGTKVAVIVGLCLIGVAVYYYFTPVYLLKPEGGVFECGSPSSPNTEAKNICGAPEQLHYARALLALGLGVLVVVLGFALFGTDSVRNRAFLDDEDEELDRDEERDRDRGERRDRDRDRDEDERDRDELLDPAESRSARHRRSARSDEDTERRRRPARDRRSDDDWASDGWR
ncbi:hypothetical protein [Janibacter corallicola]|uniref:hypothetical protein n=1 Tax=Janibacter corallicola TaxID=415212 RepID=UPI000832BDBC|nr:hypothetical protein [Janibacter corallicola]